MSQTTAQLISGTSAQSPTFGATTVTSLNGGPIAGTRNRIINGDMRIDQRNAGAAVTADGSFPVDRWKIVLGGGGALSAQQSTTVPAGFINSLAVTVTTADTSLGTSDEYSVRHAIEGFNVSDFGWGTAAAQSVTLSFKVRSSLTGTFGGVVRNSAANRIYVFSYTIAAANTFENKSITIPGDTTGTWLTDNNIGLQLILSLGAGSARLSAAGSWGTDTSIQGVTGQTQWISTNGATFYITGVQLEPGSTATPFERRSFGQELALCQRYYQIVSANLRMYLASADTVSVPLAFLQSMRSAPSAAVVTVGGIANGTNYLAENIKATGARFSATAGGGGIIERSGFEWGLSAEL